MDVLNKKGAEKRSDDMNDDTVPDVGMTIGLDGARVPSQSLKKCLLAAFALAAFCANAYFENVNGIEWEYSVYEGEAKITSLLDETPAIPYSTSGSVTVPGTLGGCPVTRIDDYAFWGCEYITSVTIPEGVETIGANAFNGCSALSEVSIPDSITAIDTGAFEECSTNLYTLIADDSVRLVDGWAVGIAVSRSDLPRGLDLSGVRGIANELFANATYMLVVKIPGGIPSVPDKAFYGCKSLRKVQIMGPVEEIGKMAFEQCKRLEEVILSSGLVRIATRAFMDCISLEQISIPATVRTIGARAFYRCESLSSVEFLGQKPSIGDSAFKGCEVRITGGIAIVVQDPPAEDETPEYQTALAGAVDARLLENITNDAEYAAFLAWAGGLENTTIETVKASPCAWLSYALDSASLIASAPGSGDVRIVGFVPSGGANAFDLSVSVAGVSVGGAASTANLEKVFAVEGAETPAEGLFGTNNVNAVFGVPANGLVKLSVSPKDPSAKSYFFRVRMK